MFTRDVYKMFIRGASTTSMYLGMVAAPTFLSKLDGNCPNMFNLRAANAVNACQLTVVDAGTFCRGVLCVVMAITAERLCRAQIQYGDLQI